MKMGKSLVIITPVLYTKSKADQKYFWYMVRKGLKHLKSGNSEKYRSYLRLAENHLKNSPDAKPEMIEF